MGGEVFLDDLDCSTEEWEKDFQMKDKWNEKKEWRLKKWIEDRQMKDEWNERFKWKTVNWMRNEEWINEWKIAKWKMNEILWNKRWMKKWMKYWQMKDGQLIKIWMKDYQMNEGWIKWMKIWLKIVKSKTTIFFWNRTCNLLSKKVHCAQQKTVEQFPWNDPN